MARLICKHLSVFSAVHNPCGKEFAKNLFARYHEDMEVSESMSIAKAADRAGVAYTTVLRAVERGHIQSEADAAGEVRVSVAGLQAWQAAREAGDIAPGRPRKQDQDAAA